MTRAEKRGRLAVEIRHEDRVADLLRWLQVRHGAALPVEQARAIRDWMRGEFYRGIVYGRRDARRKGVCQ